MKACRRVWEFDILLRCCPVSLRLTFGSTVVNLRVTADPPPKTQIRNSPVDENDPSSDAT